MLATTLPYDYEVREESDFFKSISNPRIDKKMVELAGHILDTKAGGFDASKFKDEYELALRKGLPRQIDRRRPHFVHRNRGLCAAMKSCTGT